MSFRTTMDKKRIAMARHSSIWSCFRAKPQLNDMFVRYGKLVTLRNERHSTQGYFNLQNDSQNKVLEMTEIQSSFLEKTRQRSLRQFQLRAWRESRRDYFALPDNLREKIRADWHQWAGQKSATAFRHLVDCHSGAYSKRLRDIRDSEDRHAAMVIYGLSARVAPTLKVA